MHTLRRLSLLLAGLVLASVVWAHSDAPTRGTDTAATTADVPDHEARAATLQLLDARRRLNAAASGDREKRASELAAVARRRHDRLVDLVDTNPAEVLRVALPPEERARMPAELATLVEQSADESGELEVLHVDHVNPADDFYIHFLHTPKGKFSLHFASKTPHFVTGDKVRVRGTRVDSAIVVAKAADVSAVQQPTSIIPGASGTLGAQSTLAILVNFRDAPSQPFTLAYAQSMMFGTTSSYDYETSYQQTTLSGAVAGWFTITETSGACNYGNIATQARQAAAAAGFVLSNYTRYVYVFPANTCAWWGLGSVGGHPSEAWIHSKYGFTLPVVGHEMGHNFGLYHSHSLDCGTVAYAATGCTASEYGDIFDIMGGNSGAPHYNAFQKERLGWLNAGVSPPLTTVPAVAGTTNYTIAPLEDARNSTPRALKIARSSACAASNQWLYVESRQAKGFDNFLTGNVNVQTGVLIHAVTEGNADSSYLLDMTPSTDAWGDAALVTGQTYVDPLSGVSITPVSVGGSSTTVAVTFPASSCTHAAPSVTLTPSGTVYATAGAAASYSVSVRNNDGCGCGASVFNVSAAAPAGWNATSASTASIAPAGTGSANVVVTVPASASAAFYPVVVTAANSAALTSAASANATVAITAAPPPPPPPTSLTVSATTDRSSYALPKGNSTANVLVTTSVSSGSAPVSGAAVAVQVIDPTGKVTKLNANTGSNGLATVTYSLKAPFAKKGSYGVTSVATKGTLKTTATAGFVVQ